MRVGIQERGKLIALAALAVLCAGLVYRNWLRPAEPSAAPVAASGDRAAGAASDQEGSPRRLLRSLRAGAGRREQPLTQQQLSALDPTLRLDILERSRQVKYEGSARNIFQFYTPPPPKPVSSPIVSAPSPVAPANPLAPVVNIPLKFYGMADRAGAAPKKAFLTSGEEIFIGQEGDLIANRYKIIRIGVNSIELEDSRSKQRQQLPLVEE